MTLLQYLKTMSLEQRRGFAMLCGSSAPHLRNVAYGYKHASAELAINIERESKGAVPAESVRPDVDWSVIRNSPTPSRGSRQ